jgi:hypothetical protein
MSDTSETQEAVERWRQGKINIFDEMARLERERDEARKLSAELAFEKNQVQEECLEQARLLGKGAEREDILLTKCKEAGRQVDVLLNALDRISESLAFAKRHAGK